MNTNVDQVTELPTALLEIEVTFGFRQALTASLAELSQLRPAADSYSLAMTRQLIAELSEAVAAS